VTAAFKDVGELDEIRIDIGVRVGERITFAHLRRKLNSLLRRFLSEQA